MQSLRSKLGVVALSLLATSAMYASRIPQGSFEKSYQVSGPVDLEVLTHSGDITVRKGPAGTVSISGKIYVGDRWLSNRSSDVKELEQNPPIQQSGNSIHIDYVNAKNISINYEITVPADTHVKTQSGSGDQAIEGLESNIDLTTGSGDVRLRDLKGGVKLHTGSGDVTADHLTGALEAEAGSGNIRLNEQSGGELRAHTGSGDLELREINGPLTVETGSGDVVAEGTQVGEWTLRTGSGDVQIRLQRQAAFELNATTSSGSVVVDHPLTMMVQGNIERSHKSVRGTVRGGGPLLTVHTGSGDIHIE
jgi:DUF4097 and DUF4098 domain-containing protein YvlB